MGIPEDYEEIEDYEKSYEFVPITIHCGNQEYFRRLAAKQAETAAA